MSLRLRYFVSLSYIARFDSLQEHRGRYCVHLVINYIISQRKEFSSLVCNENVMNNNWLQFWHSLMFPSVQFETIGRQCRTNELRTFKTECEEFNIFPRCLDMHPNSMPDWTATDSSKLSALNYTISETLENKRGTLYFYLHPSFTFMYVSWDSGY